MSAKGPPFGMDEVGGLRIWLTRCLHHCGAWTRKAWLLPGTVGNVGGPSHVCSLIQLFTLGLRFQRTEKMREKDCSP